MRPDPNQNVDPMRYWWREVYYRDFASNQRKPFHEQFTRATDEQWLVTEPAGWVYELVHHSKEVRDGAIALPGYSQWPAFPELSVHHRVSLTNIVDMALGFRAIATWPLDRGATPRPGYSESIPGYSWDLLADDKPLLQAFMALIQEQREKFGIQKTKGVKGVASHNRRGLPKSPDWRLVEILDHVKRQGEPLTQAQRKQGGLARQYALRFRDPVVKTIELADEGLLKVTQALVTAAPGVYGELTLDSLSLEKLKETLGQIETVLFGTAVEGAPPTSPGVETQPSGKLLEILRSFRTES